MFETGSVSRSPPAWFEELNPEQRAAVRHPDGPLLILAGAGTGKTTTLCGRVAWLVSEGVAGSLYSHISRKEDVLLQIARQTGSTFVQRAEQAVEGIEDPEAALRAICAAHLEVLDERQTAVTVYYNEWRRISSPAREEIVALRDRYQAMITDWVNAGIRAGAFEPSDPRMGVLMILSMLNWSYQWYRRDGGTDPRRLGDLFMDAILQGLRRRP